MEPWISCPRPCRGIVSLGLLPPPLPWVVSESGAGVSGRVSHCDPRGWLTPPCSPTADKGLWAQAHFGPQVSGVQPGPEAAGQGAWGRREKPGPSGPHPRAGVGVSPRPCSGPLLLRSSLLVSGAPAAVALSHCDGAACVRAEGRLSVAIIAVCTNTLF